MAPIGLAHRPVVEVVSQSGHGDPDRAAEPEARLRELIERRRDEVRAAATGDRPADHRVEEISPDGWIAGEPLF
jgi:hypothetical protein